MSITCIEMDVNKHFFIYLWRGIHLFTNIFLFVIYIYIREVAYLL